jgi:hypothetical protein
MATFNKFYNFVFDFGRGTHNFTSTGTAALTLALTSSASPPNSNNSVLADLTVVAYTNLTTRALSGLNWTQASGTAHLGINDHVLTASGGSVATFRYVALYNDTPSSPADPLIGWYDYGDNVTLLTGETLTIDFATDIITLA